MNFLQRSSSSLYGGHGGHGGHGAHREPHSDSGAAKRVKLELVPQQSDDQHLSSDSKATTDDCDANDASSTENYEPLNYKASWRQPSANDDVGDAFLTVEVMRNAATPPRDARDVAAAAAAAATPHAVPSAQ